MNSDQSKWETMLFGICLALLVGFGGGSDDSPEVDLKGVYIDSTGVLTSDLSAVVSGKLNVTVPFDESFSTTFQLSWKNHSSGESGTRQVSVSGFCTETWAVLLIISVLDCTHDDTWKIKVPLVKGGNGISVTVGNQVVTTTVVRKGILYNRQMALRVF